MISFVHLILSLLQCDPSAVVRTEWSPQIQGYRAVGDITAPRPQIQGYRAGGDITAPRPQIQGYRAVGGISQLLGSNILCPSINYRQMWEHGLK